MDCLSGCGPATKAGRCVKLGNRCAPLSEARATMSGRCDQGFLDCLERLPTGGKLRYRALRTRYFRCLRARFDCASESPKAKSGAK